MAAGWESSPLKSAPAATGGWESSPVAAKPEMSVGQRAVLGAATLGAGLATSPADVGLSMARQAVAFPASGLAGIAGAVLPGPPGQGAEFVRQTQETIGGQPFTAAGRAAVGGLGETMRPAIEAARAPGSALAEQGIPALGISPSPVAGAVLSGVPEAALAATPFLRGRMGAETLAPYKKLELGLPQNRGAFDGVDPRMTPDARRQSMGAAQTPDAAMVQASIDEAPQAVRTALQGVPVEEVQTTALDRHAKASSLPAPVPLTRGMATADSALFSEERNLRAKLPALAERLDQYPQLFQENFTLLRDSMAPDIFGEPTANNLGKDFIKLYETLNENLTGEIGAEYGQIKTLMGGRDMMVDVSGIESLVTDALQANRSLRWLPEEFKAELADMTAKGQIPFDQIDKLQSVLGRAIKGYQRSGKGNEAYAAGIFQRQLADMPLVGEVGDIKVVADRARALARARFQLIEADPAFASVVNGTARADKFLDKHVTNAGEGGAARVLQTLAGTDAQQLAKLALLKKLDDKTGTMAFAPGDRTQSRNMTAAGYDRTFRGLKDSGVLDIVFNPEEAAQLNTLGEVMRYTQQTGSGGYVNYSGTTVSAASDIFREQAGAVGAAATDAALQSVGVPAGVVKFGKGIISTLANRRFVKESLEPFAGIRRKGKPGEPPAEPPPTTPPSGPPPSRPGGPPPSGPSGPPAGGPSAPTLRNTAPQGPAPTLQSLSEPGGSQTLGTVAGRIKPQGAPDSVKIGNEYHGVQWAVVDADQISATMTLAENQFRDRTRAASAAQVSKIALQLDPNLLGRSPVGGMGAPTITRDGQIVAGNGRFSAISRAYDINNAGKYTSEIIAKLQDYGIPQDAAQGMRKPVLVRVFDKPVDVKKLAIASNEEVGLGKSPTEQAAIDSEKLGNIADLTIAEDGSISMRQNADLIRRWMGNFSKEEQATLLDSDGELSQVGTSRFRNALLHQAFGKKTDVLASFLESTDETSKNVGSALIKASPKVAEVKSMIESGARYDLDISTDIASAAQMLRKLKSEGTNVGEWLRQGEMLGESLTPDARAILEFMQANARSSNRISQMIVKFYDLVDAAGDPKQGDIFGGGAPVKQDLLREALKAPEVQENTLQSVMGF
jgi:hypothetical protein